MRKRVAWRSPSSFSAAGSGGPPAARSAPRSSKKVSNLGEAPVHRHRADPGDHPALVDERASQDLPAALADETGEAVVRQHLADLVARELG
jgi:hypothetical protein